MPSPGISPRPLIELRQLIVLLVLARQEELKDGLRRGSCECWAANPRGDGATLARMLQRSEPDHELEHNFLKLQAVGAILLMIIELNIALLHSVERLPPVTPQMRRDSKGIDECVELRRREEEELAQWKRALCHEHCITESVSLDSLLDQLHIDDGEVVGELRLPLSDLMASGH